MIVVQLIEIEYEIVHFMHKNPIIYKVIMAKNHGEVRRKVVVLPTGEVVAD